MPAKKYLRKFFVFLLVLIFMWQYVPLIKLTGGFEVLLIAAAVLTALDSFLKPILKTIMIPVNTFTFGLLSWISAVLVFYLTTTFVKGLEVVSFTIPEIYTDYYTFPQTEIAGVWAYIVSAAFVVILAKFINWVFKKKCV